jgi:hypothetical protein
MSSFSKILAPGLRQREIVASPGEGQFLSTLET